MSKKVGIAAALEEERFRNLYKQKNEELICQKISNLLELVEQFKIRLESFAKMHRHEINQQPNLRRHFQQLCASIGVDPLTSSRSMWSKVLGIGNFYFELAVQIIEVSMALRDQTGGLIEINFLLSHLNKKRSNDCHVSCTDIVKAVDRLKILGSGYQILEVNQRKYLSTVPSEMNVDATSILTILNSEGCQTVITLMEKTLWKRERIDCVLNILINNQIIWIDQHQESEYYWTAASFIR